MHIQHCRHARWREILERQHNEWNDYNASYTYAYYVASIASTISPGFPAHPSSLELVPSSTGLAHKLKLVEHLTVQARIGQFRLERLPVTDGSDTCRRAREDQVALLYPWSALAQADMYMACRLGLASSFMIPETKEMSSGTPKIMSLAVPDCLTEPLMAKCSPT